MQTKSYSVGTFSTVICQKEIYLLTECHTCGQLFSGHLYMNVNSKEEFDTLAKDAGKVISKCPICGAKIFQKPAYSVWGKNYTVKLIADLKKELHDQIARFEEEASRATIIKQIPDPKLIQDMPSDNNKVKEIKNDITSMKTYIRQLIDLEIWSCFAEKHIINIDSEINSRKKAQVYSNWSDKNNAKKETAKQAKDIRKQIAEMERQFAETEWSERAERITIEMPIAPRYKKESIPLVPIKPITKKPGLFNKKAISEENEKALQEYEKACILYDRQCKALESVRAENALLRIQYEKAMEKYSKDTDAEERRFKAETRRLKNEGAARKEEARKELDRKIAELEKEIDGPKSEAKTESRKDPVTNLLIKEKNEYIKTLKILCETRSKLYSINAIYPNYRDVSALSSFYEYLNSERCYDLEGPDGAYNLYETERHSDTIATFFRTLEDINKKQVILYSELAEMFEKLNKLNDSLKKATTAIEKKEKSAKAEITQDCVRETLKDFCTEGEEYRQHIKQTIEGALTYLL